jgi:hypothetical protein
MVVELRRLMSCHGGAMVPDPARIITFGIPLRGIAMPRHWRASALDRKCQIQSLHVDPRLAEDLRDGGAPATSQSAGWPHIWATRRPGAGRIGVRFQACRRRGEMSAGR